MSMTVAAETRPGLGSTQDVADFLQIPEATLRQWRARGTGPRWRRIGRHVRYRWTDVEAWYDGQPGGGDNADA